MNQVDQLTWAYPPPTNSHRDSASRLFYQAVLVLKSVGNLPVQATTRSIDADHHRQVIHYTFSIKSFTFPYCLILTTFVVIAWIQFISEYAGLNPFSFTLFIEKNYGVSLANVSTAHQLSLLDPLSVAQTMIHVIFPLSSCIQYLSTIWTSLKFAEYANGWTIFEETFRRIFKMNPLLNEAVFPETTRFRRLSWNFTLCLVVVIGLTIYPMTLTQERLSGNAMSMKWPVTFVGFLTFFITLLLDFRCNLMLYINQEAFSQIGTKIAAEVECSQSSVSRINSTLVQNWQLLISYARKQTVSGGQILSTSLLVELINLFGTWCSIIYQTIFFAQRDGLGWTSLEDLGLNYSLCGIMYFRFAIKIFLSERMTIAEAKIAKSLQLIENHSDLGTSLEINIVVDWIATPPSKINIANLFALNRSLLFGVMGQTVTYVLVLLQFQTIQGT
ncbi:Gustatory and odorant receptor 24 [Folsomia candida]|uniref:Gustatory and odorant receptor 24 n=2 Tax=Folsomia candida TaxID=158441 RepID=A0A226F2Y4_FOLCA|nr:Gustatory and odorant receptor 24 [Folsomia candida]